MISILKLRVGKMFLGFTMLFVLASCQNQEDELLLTLNEEEIEQVEFDPIYLYKHVVDRNIIIGEYFSYIDSLVCHYDTLTPYLLDEYLLVRFNAWIIDALADTDYYRMMEKDQFVFDQKAIVLLHKGDSILIPTLTEASVIFRKQAQTEIDVNLPEFKLRIVEDGQVIYNFPIRVGQNKERYLETAKRNVNLQTQTGKGQIVRVKRNPTFINPVDGKRFIHTRRDDEKLTIMPLIPWIGTEINGLRYGQMIHPTTNPKTLGKAYSNGCIGTKEADAWYIYYHAPIGTKITIRYDLDIINEQGDTIKLQPIYNTK